MLFAQLHHMIGQVQELLTFLLVLALVQACTVVCFLAACCASPAIA